MQEYGLSERQAWKILNLNRSVYRCTNPFTFAGHGIALVDILLPTHSVVALNKIFTLEAGLSDVAFELIMLIVFSALYFAIGFMLFYHMNLR